jgi:hypothetical protein
VKRSESGKQAKKARKELAEITADANSEIVIEEENEERKDEKPQRPIGIKAAKATVKIEKKDTRTQLEVDRLIAAAQRGKAEAAQTQARIFKDEFLFKLIAFNPDAAEAKEWMALKIAEAVTEAKEMKLKKERELEQMVEEMARSKKEVEQKKTLKPAQFVHNPNDIEKEAEVASANVTLSSVSSVSFSPECNQQQQTNNVCCAGDYCFVSNGHKVVCGMTCNRCRQSCHFDCCEDDEYGFKICASCEKERACDEYV